MSRAKFIEIDGRKIGEGFPVFIIAEAGINHNGDLKMAKQMIDEAAVAGVDCVKFQSFKADLYISRNAPRASYQNAASENTATQLDLLKDVELKREFHRELIDHCASRGVAFLSTPFELDSLQFLVDLGVPAIKVGSDNLNNYPFLEKVARTQLPIILSTGMSTLSIVEKAVERLERYNSPLILLQCTSNYPSRIENSNIRAMQTLRQAFGYPVGFSDHTPNNVAAIVAVALSAVVCEKHFTLDRDLPGIDQAASIEPDELRQYVRDIRNAAVALGSPRKQPADEEQDTRIALRRSLVAAQDIPAGTILEKSRIAIKRPGNGLAPEYLPLVIGRQTKRDIKFDELLRLEDLT